MAEHEFQKITAEGLGDQGCPERHRLLAKTDVTLNRGHEEKCSDIPHLWSQGKTRKRAPWQIEHAEV